MSEEKENECYFKLNCKGDVDFPEENIYEETPEGVYKLTMEEGEELEVGPDKECDISSSDFQKEGKIIASNGRAIYETQDGSCVEASSVKLAKREPEKYESSKISLYGEAVEIDLGAATLQSCEVGLA